MCSVWYTNFVFYHFLFTDWLKYGKDYNNISLNAKHQFQFSDAAFIYIFYIMFYFAHINLIEHLIAPTISYIVAYSVFNTS
jgi:hypothetical protein